MSSRVLILVQGICTCLLLAVFVNSQITFLKPNDSFIGKLFGAMFELAIIPLILSQIFFLFYSIYSMIKKDRTFPATVSLLLSIVMIVIMFLLD